jgi:hypothetical protein
MTSILHPLRIGKHIARYPIDTRSENELCFVHNPCREAKFHVSTLDTRSETLIETTKCYVSIRVSGNA